MPLRRDPFDDLTLDQKALVNRLCEEFEQALLSGCRQRIEDCLGDSTEPVRSVLVRELLLLEYLDHVRQGTTDGERELRARFPNCEDLVTEVVLEAQRYAPPLSPRPAGGDEACSPAGNPEPPRKIGRFRLKRVLSSGGFGTVYLAEDPTLASDVALKVPRLEILLTPALRRRFLREAEAAAILDHPHVARVLDAGEVGFLCYIAFAYVPGTTLAAWLRDQKARGEPVPIACAARLTATLAETIQHAHERGVLHCDLKPANVLLADGPDLFPVITDFGLAHLIGPASDLSQTGQILGTPAYMAPEQAAGRRKDVTPRTDIYGLGAILYQLLAGTPPFPGDSSVEVLHRVLAEDPVPLRSHRPQVPLELATVCQKCLEKEPGKRYASAQEFADDLRRFLSGEPVRARCIGPLGRAWRWCRRKPIVAGLLAGVILSLLGGFASTRYQLRQTETARREAETALHEAEASDAQVQQLLNEVLHSRTYAPDGTIRSQKLPDLATLLHAEDHFAGLLQKRSGDLRVRMALTKVRGSLGSLYGLQGQTTEMDACYQGARDLWETLTRQDLRDPECRDWLATTYYWQAQGARLQGHFERWLRLRQQAYACWQELAEEQPGNVELMAKVAAGAFDLQTLRDPGLWREEFLRPLEDDKALLGNLVADAPANTVLRKRLALVYLSLGEFCLGKQRKDAALPYWRQAYEHYRLLAPKQPDDPLVQLHLALCCFRLMANQSSDPYYREAVARFGQAANRLAALAQQYPSSDWPQAALLDSYCWLAVCHWKVGRATLAEQTFQERVRPLLAQIREHRADQLQGLYWLEELLRGAGRDRHGGQLRLQGLYWLEELLRAANLLQEKPAAALVIVREAAALTERYADTPSRDLLFCERLAEHSVNISAFLCRLGDPGAALRQGEQGLRLYAGLCRAVPAAPQYNHGLSLAWERIAKARWKLGRHNEALAAFRESAAAQRQVVAQAPSVFAYRVQLSRCYDRLAYWGGLCGDRATVAAALLEREKLWPDDAEQLMEVSRDFQKLAEAIGKGREQLSAEQQAERQRYLAEGDRARRLAEGTGRRAGTERPTPTDRGQPQEAALRRTGS